MPGIKKLHQESENSSKAEYIFGHMFGGVGVLVGGLSKMFCIPLSMKIHDGVKTIHSWNKLDTEEENVNAGKEDVAQETHVVQMIENGFTLTKIMGQSLLILDRYFLSVPALKKLAILNKTSLNLLHILTKAKKTCIAYTEPVEYKGRGR